MNSSNEILNFFIDSFNDNEYNVLTLPKKENYLKSEEEDVMGKFNVFITHNDYEKTKKLIETLNISPMVFFMSFYGFIMSKYSNQKNIYSAFIKGTKDQEEAESNLFPVLMKCEDDKSIKALVEEVNQFILNYEKSSISFSELSGRMNLLQVNNIFLYEKLDKPEDEKVYCLETTKKFDIIFKVFDLKNQYSIIMEYNKKLYNEKLIKNILDSYLKVIDNENNFNERIVDIDYISDEELNRIIDKFNGNRCEYGSPKSKPDECAIIFEKQKITFRQLHEMSNSLAHYLRSMGIQKNEVVPLIIDRSYYLVVAALAVLKAGAAFLFIDTEFPKDRIEFLLREVNAKIVIKYLIKNPLTFNIPGLYEYNFVDHNFNENIMDVENINDIDDLSCVFFTSGTTGRPKGILITHSNLINYSYYSSTYSGDSDFFEDKFKYGLAFTKVTYIICLSEIFYFLIKDKCIVLCNNEEYNNPTLLGDIIRDCSADFIIGPPTRIKYYLLNENFRKYIGNIKTFIFGGEGATLDFLTNLLKFSNAYFYYGYGLTETTVTSTVGCIEHDDIINKRQLTIGRPACNCEVYILDSNMKPVPVGVEGEIYISGNSICKGYLNNEKLTNEIFVDCPFNNKDGSKKKKMYKTGDLGKWTDDGRVINLGRIDFQVKIRGQRIELGEIENTVKEIKTLDCALVIDKKKENGEKYLVCYYITNDVNVDGTYIRSFLSKKMPIYMIPNYFIKIDKIPVTAHGKLDRKSLPEPNIDEILSSNYVAPTTDTEKKVCRMFSSVFNIEVGKIGKNTNLFDLGSNSLNTIKILTMIERELKIKLNIKDVFKYPTIASLSSHIDDILTNYQH
ncbi:hypothetical protein PIROE2DRAFT_17438, partial [Piromyces sp. E2]